MFCENCGNKLNDEALFCPKCGCKVEDNEEVDISDANGQFSISGESKKKNIGVIVGVVIALCVIGILLFAIWKTMSEENENQESVAEEYEQLEVIETEVETESVTIEDSETEAEVIEDSVTEVIEASEAEPVIVEEIVQEPEMESAIVLSQEEIEAEVLRIREVWNYDREAITNNIFQVTELEGGVRLYSDVETRMLVVDREIIDEYSRVYQIESGKLTFAYYESATTQIRLYYKDEVLFRWIQTESDQEAVIHDNEIGNPDFVNMGNMGLQDYRSIYCP